MASGTIMLNESASSGARLAARIVWSSSADAKANTSSVTAKLYVRKYNPDTTLTIPTAGAWPYKLTVNGSGVSGSVSKSVLLDWVLLCTKTVTVSHDDDGTKSITVSGSISGPSVTGFSGHTSSGSGTAKLDAIARASAITSVTSVTLGNKCGVKWTPASKSFRYKLKFTLGDWSYTTEVIHPNQTSAYTYAGYTIPLSVAAELTRASSGTMTAALYTYSDSEATTQIGSASSKTFTVTVPDNSDTKPTVTMTLTPVSSLSDSFDGLFIQGKTKVKATLSATGKYDAAIESYSMKAEGVTYLSDDSCISDFLSQCGSLAIYGYARDSRGFLGSISQDINVIPYTKPKIQNVSAARCDSYGNLTDSGTYLRISASRDYSPVLVDNVQKNFCAIRFLVYDENGSEVQSDTTILEKGDLGANSVTTGALLDGKLAVDKTYMVDVQACDDISVPTTATVVIPTEKVYMHRAGARRSLSIGEYVEEDNTVAIAPDLALKVKGDLIVIGKGWQTLGLSDSVVDATSQYGRGAEGSGCWYRVENGNHVYIAFNCGYSWVGNSITVNAEKIPEEYRPARTARTFAATTSKNIARIYASAYGNVVIEWVQSLTSGTETAELTSTWIDGYIDYFV